MLKSVKIVGRNRESKNKNTVFKFIPEDFEFYLIFRGQICRKRYFQMSVFVRKLC